MKQLSRAIITAVAGLGLAVGGAAPATAERVWDIGAYDNCMVLIPTLPNDYEWYHWKCCTDSGGDYDFHQHKCVAPPAEADNVPGNTSPTTGKPRPPLTPGDSVGVSDDPAAGTPLPTPTPRPRPDAPSQGGVG
jgi:hypothetical protein